jgi:hypothetical protein
MISISGEINGAEQVIGNFSSLANNQIPYALSRAINACAQKSQSAIINQMPSIFHIRNNWIQKGVRVQYSSKSNLVARVYDKDWFMGLQETGGTKAPISAKHEYVPGAAIRSNDSLISRSNRIGALIQKMKAAGEQHPTGKRRGRKSKPVPFIINLSSGKRALVQRESKAAYPLRVLYIFEPDVKVKPVFNFYKTVRDVVYSIFPAEFKEALIEAIRTAK